MNLDFERGTVEFINDYQAIAEPSNGLKIEDNALIPNHANETTFTHGDQLFYDLAQDDAWLVSEANSRLVKTNAFLSKGSRALDLSFFDPGTFSTSRLIRVDLSTGAVLEEAEVPHFAQWDQTYDWESTMCTSDRPFQGLHALSIIPSTDVHQVYDHQMFVGMQSALYQDGSTPKDFMGNATRVLVYVLTRRDNRLASFSKYLKTFRYDTSQLTMKSYQKGARHFNGLFGFITLDDNRFLVVECEDLTIFGFTGRHEVLNRIFYVELSDEENTISQECHSLLECFSTIPPKKISCLGTK